MLSIFSAIPINAIQDLSEAMETMDPLFPEPPPFTTTDDRREVTLEPPQLGDDCSPEHNDREWIDWRNQGGGYVPEDHTWTSNPKQVQDDLGNG
jgi:hypothetical protein